MVPFLPGSLSISSHKHVTFLPNCHQELIQTHWSIHCHLPTWNNQLGYTWWTVLTAYLVRYKVLHQNSLQTKGAKYCTLGLLWYGSAACYFLKVLVPNFQILRVATFSTTVFLINTIGISWVHFSYSDVLVENFAISLSGQPDREFRSSGMLRF